MRRAITLFELAIGGVLLAGFAAYVVQGAMIMADTAF